MNPILEQIQTAKRIHYLAYIFVYKLVFLNRFLYKSAPPASPIRLARIFCKTRRTQTHARWTAQATDADHVLSSQIHDVCAALSYGMAAYLVGIRLNAYILASAAVSLIANGVRNAFNTSLRISLAVISGRHMLHTATKHNHSTVGKLKNEYSLQGTGRDRILSTSQRMPRQDMQCNHITSSLPELRSKGTPLCCIDCVCKYILP